MPRSFAMSFPWCSLAVALMFGDIVLVRTSGGGTANGSCCCDVAAASFVPVKKYVTASRCSGDPWIIGYRNEEEKLDFNPNVNSTSDHSSSSPSSVGLVASSRFDQRLPSNKVKYEQMPWKASISKLYSHHNGTLPFMPYYTYSKSIITSRLQNVKPYDFDKSKYHYHEVDNKHENKNRNNNEEPVRMINECYKSDEFRKIRMTYYDGGNKLQVFNSLWYPHYSLGSLPLLGIDLLCFNGRKCLCVVDFQPLTHVNKKDKDIVEKLGGDEDNILTPSSPSSYLQNNMDHDFDPDLKSLWDDLPVALKGKMSNRFYDEHQFFSKYMIFGRFDLETENTTLHENEDLWNSFEKYIIYYVDSIQGQLRKKNKKKKKNDEMKLTPPMIMKGQQEYDEYSAERDPAKPMFGKVFGDEFAMGYVHDFLFELSACTDEAK